jgi:molybdopterin synthase catalytic subunit
MIEIRRDDFCVDEIIKKMKSPKRGALSIYVGTVREFPEGVGLEFEDSSQAAQILGEIAERAINSFDVGDVAIIHRVGFLGIAENIVLVAVSAAHREPAFSACRTIIDDIKNLHKSWGKEVSRQQST